MCPSNIDAHVSKYPARIAQLAHQRTFMREVPGSDSWLNLAGGWLNPPSLCG